MRIWTAHAKPGRTPVLVREGFSWGALLFGPLWLLLHRAWIPAIVALVAGVLLGLAPGAWSGLLDIGLAVGLGLFGRDLCRWSLGLRGAPMIDLVAGRDEDDALARLLDRRPDLLQTSLIDIAR